MTTLQRKTPWLAFPPDEQCRFAAGDIAPISCEGFAAFIRAELAKWSKVIKNAGVKPD